MKACELLSLLTIFLLSCNGITALLKRNHNKIVTCYVASWAVYRPNNGKFEVGNIQPELCTHLVYAFAGLNTTSWTIRSFDPSLDIGNGNYRKMTQLRQKHRDLNVLLAIGGWSEGSKNYSILASSPERRSTFIKSVVTFLREYDFNGFDLDWEYPGSRDGAPEDKQNFALLVKELKEAFKESNYLLTAAISSNQGIIDAAYDIPEISKYLDHINVMAYDYHGTWDGKVLPNAPLNSDDGLNVMDTLKYLLNKGAPVNKLVLGLPMYGRTFILKNKLSFFQENPMNQPIISDGFMGPYTKQNGFMGYNEICEELMRNKTKWRTGWDDNSKTPYAINEDHVIVFDNPKSLKLKVEYAISLNLAGVMSWSIDTDDFTGTCASWSDSPDTTENTYPLMRSIIMVLQNSNNNDDSSNKNNTENKKHPNVASIKLSSTFVLMILLTFVYYV